MTYLKLFKKVNFNKLIRNITQHYSVADQIFSENLKSLPADYTYAITI